MTSTTNGLSETLLHAHRFLLRAGFSIGNVFAWIFIFQYFAWLSGDVARAVAATALLYVLTQFITIIATPISAAHLQRGIKQSLVWGIVAAGAAFTMLGGTFGGYFNSPAAWGIAAFATLLGLYRALYWIPYKLAVAEIQPHLHMRAYLEALIALMPLFAGMTIASVASGELRLLFGAATLIILSGLPALFIVNTRERFSWPYSYTYKQLFRRRNHGLVLQSIFEGIQGTALFLIWPLAIFLIVESSYLTLGFVFSITLLIILLLRRVYAWTLNRFGLGESALIVVVFAISGWIARLAAGTPVGIIIADSYSYTTNPSKWTRSDPFSFEQMSDRGSFIDEYTALKEIALALGRLMVAVVVYLLSFVFAIPVVFAIVLVLAAFASGISILIAQRRVSAAY